MFQHKIAKYQPSHDFAYAKIQSFRFKVFENEWPRSKKVDGQ